MVQGAPYHIYFADDSSFAGLCTLRILTAFFLDTNVNYPLGYHRLLYIKP